MAAHWSELARWLEESGASTIFGFVASVIAIVGVPLSYWKARQAKSAADAARVAAETAVGRVRDVDAVFRLASALGSLGELIGKLGSGDPHSLVAQGLRLRVDLTEIAELQGRLVAVERDKILALIAALRELEGALDDWPASDEKLVASREALRLRHDEAYTVLVRLRYRVARRDDAT